ncbi:hypothetical protein CWC31_05240 [Pseudoalteromonas ruthenica]|nr:hypothetical protein CWC31_05240 [Pseudoalteromonas ruthenica]
MVRFAPFDTLDTDAYIRRHLIHAMNNYVAHTYIAPDECTKENTMKRTALLTSALTLGLLSTTAAADSSKFVAADNSAGTELCMAITKNSPLKLRRSMKEHYVNTYTMENKLACNDLTVRQFASLYGFDRSLKVLNIERLTETSIRDLAAKNDTDSFMVYGSK